METVSLTYNNNEKNSTKKSKIDREDLKKPELQEKLKATRSPEGILAIARTLESLPPGWQVEGK